MIPFIVLINILSNITHALSTLAWYGIKHGNISIRSIFHSHDLNWMITTPNYQKINLWKWLLFEKDVNFLLNETIPDTLGSTKESALSTNFF